MTEKEFFELHFGQTVYYSIGGFAIQCVITEIETSITPVNRWRNIKLSSVCTDDNFMIYSRAKNFQVQLERLEIK